MKKLNELRSLLNLAQALGQTPDPKLVAEVERLEQCEARLRNRIRKNMTEDLKELNTLLGKKPAVVENAEPVVISRMIAPASNPDVIVTAPDPVQPLQEKLQPETVSEPSFVDRVAKTITETVVSQGKPVLVPKPADPLEFKVKQLEAWISRIAATGPGGGAGQIYNLDIPVKTVTGDYTIGRKDYYVGVNATVKTYITLPQTGSNLKDGRVIVVKDESGHAQLTPIKLVGTIDNDPNGAEIRINNGAVQLVWRTDGWRII